MTTSFDVHFWEIQHRPERRKPFSMRWRVGPRVHTRSFLTKPLADSRRSELMAAARRGEAFDVESGVPLSELRAARQAITWYQHARDYIDRVWKTTPPNTRETLGDALATLTPALVTSEAGRPPAKALRGALYGFAFNRNRWDKELPDETREVLAWIERRSIPLQDLENPLVLKSALAALGLKLDGTPAAASTARRKRAIFHAVLGYAVDCDRFTVRVNPMEVTKVKPPATAEAIDPAYVANPRQVRTLLKAVRGSGARGRHLEAFFACMYHAGMRPAEVTGLKKSWCTLPKRGWGKLRLRRTRPQVGIAWTDDGQAHQDNGLKARARDEVRTVPIPPRLVAMLRWHLYRYGTAADGRVFQTARGGPIQNTGYGEAWEAARKAALSPDQFDSPLAKRPYDLRHAGISFWLASGVPPAEVAARAGHSLAVLFRVYAKVLAEAEERANRRIDDAMEEWEEEDDDG